MMGIYAIVNMCDGKQYIGSSVDINRRWREHRKKLRRGEHHCQHLQRAWEKYGKESFEWRIIAKVDDKKHLIDNEQRWIDAIPKNKLYNTALNVRESVYGRADTLQARNAVVSAIRKKMNSPEMREKISIATRAALASPEMRAKISNANRGRIFTHETRAKISAAKMGTKPSEQSLIAARKAWAKLTEKDVVNIRIWTAAGFKPKFLATKLGVCESTIRSVIRGESWRHVA